MTESARITVRLGTLDKPLAARAKTDGVDRARVVQLALAAYLGVDPPVMLARTAGLSERKRKAIAKKANQTRWSKDK